MPTDEHPLPIVAIVGATASGKTGLSLDLAAELGGEIVNTDAMQLYRGMDVGTAKLPPAQRRGIPHHLLDRLDVTETATVADFQGWARAEIDEIRGRGRAPVLVGGSALYTRAILDRFEFPGTDESVRRELEGELASAGTAGAAPAAGRPRSRGRGRRSAPTTVAASSGRSRSSRSPAAPTPRASRRPPTPTRTASRSASTSTGPPSTRASRRGCGRCTTQGWSTRSSGCSTSGWSGPDGAPGDRLPRGASAFLRGEISRDEAVVADAGRDARFARRQDGVVPQGPARRLGAVRRRAPRRAGTGCRARHSTDRPPRTKVWGN